MRWEGASDGWSSRFAERRAGARGRCGTEGEMLQDLMQGELLLDRWDTGIESLQTLDAE